MAKKIKIAGCLETPATGNIVTTAYSVEDEAWKDGSTLDDRRQTTINRRLKQDIDTLQNKINNIPIQDLSELEAAVQNHTSQITQINQTNRNQDALINNKVDTEVYNTGQAQQDANIDRLSGNVNTLENLTRINLEGDVGVIVDFDNVIPENPNVTTGNAIAQVLQAVQDNNPSPNTEYKASKWLQALLDSANKFLAGVDTHGDLEWKYNKVGQKASKGWIRAILDSNNKVLQGTLSDGTFWAPNVETKYFHSDGMIQAVVDHEGKILGYRDTNGAWHEKNLIVENLTVNGDSFSPEGTSSNYINDWSKENKIILPFPEEGAKINIIIPESYYQTSEYLSDKMGSYREFVKDGLIKYGLVYKKYNPGSTEKIVWNCELEYFDKKGNYFKKPCQVSAQGNSTLQFEAISQNIKFSDKIKIGSWVAQKSFHLKKYYQDIFRGQCVVAYKLMEEVYLSHDHHKERPWNYTIESDSTVQGLGKPKKDFNTGALGHPDGFPVEVFINNKSVGIFAFNLKKHADNYYLEEDKAKCIMLDGILNSSQFWDKGSSPIVWSNFEVRNPENLIDINNQNYNGDFPTELSNMENSISKTVKNKIVRLTEAIPTIDAISDIEQRKLKFKEYFNLDSLIDYVLLSEVIYHKDGFRKNWIWCTWDGNIWSPTLYDTDAIFGLHYLGHTLFYKSEFDIITSPESRNGTVVYGPDKYILKLTGNPVANNTSGLFWNEAKARYAELRNLGIFTVDHITDVLENWIEQIGYTRLKDEIDLFPDTPSYRSDLVDTEYWERIEYIPKNQSSSLSVDYFFDYSGNCTNAPGVVAIAAGKIAQVGNIAYPIYYRAKQTVPQDHLMPCQLYSHYPNEGGIYNSVQRVKNWLTTRLQTLDTYFEYNNN